jgi:hypothetical protein
MVLYIISNLFIVMFVVSFAVQWSLIYLSVCVVHVLGFVEEVCKV